MREWWRDRHWFKWLIFMPSHQNMIEHEAEPYSKKYTMHQSISRITVHCVLCECYSHHNLIIITMKKELKIPTADLLQGAIRKKTVDWSAKNALT